jgi:hypothetical protein
MLLKNLGRHRADEELASSMERRGRRTGAARWDESSSSLRNFTLLEGVANNTEEYGRRRGCVRYEEGRSRRRG